MAYHYTCIHWHFHICSVKFRLSELQLLFPCPKSNLDTASAVIIGESLFLNMESENSRSQSGNPNTRHIHEDFLRSSKLAGDDLTPNLESHSVPTIQDVRSLTRLQRSPFLEITPIGKKTISLWIFSSLQQTWTLQDRLLQVPYSFRT